MLSSRYYTISKYPRHGTCAPPLRKQVPATRCGVNLLPCHGPAGAPVPLP
jgi:hypothetical protein